MALDVVALKRERLALKRRKLLLTLRRDLPTFAKVCLRIKSKAGKIEPLALNQAQRYLHGQIDDQLQQTGRVRVIGLKGRQQGFSTYTEGRGYWKASQTAGLTAYILTHEQSATDNVFAMAQRFHDYCPAWWRPATKAANAKELAFADLDSGYKVGTAGSKAVGRSTTIQFFHGSEVAHWPHAESHFAGVLQAVPDAAGSEIILESTANGVGGMFHDLWVAAERGENEYRAVFVPWFWQTEYRKPVPSDFQPDAKEKELMKLYGLDAGQILFRRAKIGELRGELMFMQEYPCNPNEAFIASGRPVFDPLLMEKARRDCFAPAQRLALREKKFVAAPGGELRVWFDPEPGKRYVIGADVAEGLEHGDYSCASVLQSPEGYQVAQWHGHIAPDRFGLMLDALGKRYNRAFLGVERNNHGLTTVTTLRDAGYPDLYVQRDLEDRGGKDSETKKVGWLTTSKSKPKIIDQLAAELADGELGVFDTETLDEMSTYRVLPDGSFGAQQGRFDDRVMARAIAGEMLRADYGYRKSRQAA